MLTDNFVKQLSKQLLHTTVNIKYINFIIRNKVRISFYLPLHN